MSDINTAPAPSDTPVVANLRETRKEMAAAKKRHPAGTATKKTAKKATERKAPTASGKTKLRWTGDIAKLADAEIGRRVKQADGTYHAIVKVGGKNQVLAKGVSKDRAYSVVVAFYHRGERPVAKKAS